MFRFILNISVCLAVLANAIPLEKLDSKIVGGDETKIEDHPFQVSIEYYGLHICGGTLFGKQFIITAATCVQNVNPDKLYVRMGTPERNKGGNLIKIIPEAVSIHDCYNPETVEYDIAILKLAEEVPAENIAKEIDGFAHESYPIVNDADGTVTGWGYTEEGGNLADILQAVTVPLIDKESCTGYEDRVKDSMFCAGVKEGGKDACQGDAGSPLVQPNPDIPGQRILVGIVSWGEGCARPDRPGVYTSIPKADKWLRRELGISEVKDPVC